MRRVVSLALWLWHVAWFCVHLRLAWLFIGAGRSARRASDRHTDKAVRHHLEADGIERAPTDRTPFSRPSDR